LLGGIGFGGLPIYLGNAEIQAKTKQKACCYQTFNYYLPIKIHQLNAPND
jgi:hypothetical protein